MAGMPKRNGRGMVKSPRARGLCLDCDQQHDGCRGHRARTGDPCGRPVVPGLDVCRGHSGKAVEKAEAEGVLRQAATLYGLPRQVDPAVALLEEVWRTAGHVQWLADKVASLDEAGLVWGASYEKDKPLVVGGGEGAAATVEYHTEKEWRADFNLWLRLYREERKHLAAVSRDALAAGVAERQVALLEQQASNIVAVLKLVLADSRLGIAVGHDVQQVVVRQALSAMSLEGSA